MADSRPETQLAHVQENASKLSGELDAVPEVFQEAVLVKSEPMPKDAVVVRGYDFSGPLDHHLLLQSFRTTGFQATNFGLAVEEINKMVRVGGVQTIPFEDYP